MQGNAEKSHYSLPSLSSHKNETEKKVKFLYIGQEWHLFHKRINKYLTQATLFIDDDQTFKVDVLSVIYLYFLDQYLQLQYISVQQACIGYLRMAFPSTWHF